MGWENVINRDSDQAAGHQMCSSNEIPHHLNHVYIDYISEMFLLNVSKQSASCLMIAEVHETQSSDS
mgnify:CR=1 FL=1